MKNFFTIILIVIFTFVLESPLWANPSHKQEKFMLASADDPYTKRVIAVSDFANNTGDLKLNYLKELIANSITTNLVSNSDGSLSVVERSQFQALIKEMGFIETGYIDLNTATKIGNSLGATQIIVGDYAKVGDIIRLNVRMIDIKTGQIILATSENGNTENDMFNMIDRVSAKLLNKITGQYLKATPKPTPKPVQTQTYTEPEPLPPIIEIDPAEKNGNALWIASIFVPGLGQILSGQFQRGAAFLLPVALSILFTFILISNVIGIPFLMLAIIMHIWNVVDAFSLSNPK